MADLRVIFTISFLAAVDLIMLIDWIGSSL